MPNEDLEFEIKVMARDMAKLQSDVRENYGLIKELSGKQIMMERIEEIQSDNMKQERSIGSLEKGMQQVADALSRSSDKGLANAAKAITINVDAKTSIDGDVAGDVAGGEMNK